MKRFNQLIIQIADKNYFSIRIKLENSITWSHWNWIDTQNRLLIVSSLEYLVGALFAMRFIIIRVFCTITLSLEISGESITRHTNVKCEVLDKSFAEFPVCKLNVLGRGIIAESVYMKFLKLPIKKISVNFTVYKKLSGYHPFLFNVTVDFCHYMKHPNPMNIFHYFYTAVKPYSNFNHSCPYNVSEPYAFNTIILY